MTEDQLQLHFVGASDQFSAAVDTYIDALLENARKSGVTGVPSLAVIKMMIDHQVEKALLRALERIVREAHHG